MAQKRKNENTVWSPAVKVITVICIAVLAAAIVFAAVAKNGFFEKHTVAMKVGDTEISAHELNYAYYSAINTFYSQAYYYVSSSLDFSKSLKEQQCAVDTSITWYDYFLNSARNDCQDVYLLYNKAQEENFQLTEASQKALDDTIAELKETAKTNKTSVSNYLSSVYGRGMSEGLYREYLERRLLASDFYNAYLDSLNYTDAQINETYAENANDYDLASYYSYTVTLPAADEETNEATEDNVVSSDGTETDDASSDVDAVTEEPAADTAEESLTTVQIAEQIVANSDSLESFLAQIEAQVNSDSFSADQYLRNNQSYTKDNEVSEWVFSSDRQPGDVGYVESESGTVTVLWFLDRSREEYPLASMRHILLNVETLKDDEGNTKKDEEGNDLTNDEEQKAKAEELLQTWKDNGGTEDAFTALVADNTDDTASASTGGLYEDFDQSTMVTEITDWIWADGRKTGDCEIVKSTYGYHLVYFVGYGETKWKSDVVADLKEKDFDAYKEELQSQYPVEQNESALKYVGY